MHNHSDHSNTRGFLDSTNKVKALIEYAKECGHNGIAFTEHDTISSHMEVENTITALRKEDPEKWNDFKIILGNEIYLCDREQIEERKEYIFPHFILLAKDEIGHKQIRELSTRAWIENSFTYVNIRTPTYYEDLEEIVGKNPGHLVAQSACLGGWLPRLILKANEFNPLAPDYGPAKRWIKKMVKIFGEGNFFLEMQPSNQEDQLIVNKALVELSDELGIDYVITTD